MDIKKLSSLLWDRCSEIVDHLLPNAEKISSGWQVGNISGEKGQSLKITPNKQLWYDFNTGDCGDLIDLWAKINNVKLSFAILDIAKFLNININESHNNYELNNENYINLINDLSINYLSTRGINNEISVKYGIRNASIYNPKKNQYESAVAFPYYKNDKLVQIKRIGIHRIDGKKNIATEKNCKQYLFGHQNINKELDYIIICEGEIDCLSLFQYGFNTLSVPFGGGKGKKQQWIENENEFLKNFDKIYLCFDEDQSGMDASNYIARELYNKKCYKLKLPYKDPNECLMKGVSAEYMKYYFQQAKRIHIRRSNLPISIGSDGFDAKQNYLIKNHIPTNSLCCIYGASGSFKTFLSLSWACHIASGKNWDSNSVSKASVLYIVGEGGIGVPKRIKAWETAYNITLNNLYLVNRPVFIISDNDLQEIQKACDDIKNETNINVGLIVIDTLARCLGDADENTAKDMGSFISGCDKIKSITGATVLLIHHTGKNEDKGARGSSVLRASLDCEFYINRDSDNETFILTTTKMKDAEAPAPKLYELNKVNIGNSNDESIISSSLVLNDDSKEPKYSIPYELQKIKNLSNNHVKTFEAIKFLSKENGFFTKNKLKNHLEENHLNTEKVNKWLNKLASEKLIKIDDEIITLLR